MPRLLARRTVLAQGVEAAADATATVGRVYADVGAVIVLAVGVVVAATAVTLDIVQRVLRLAEIEVDEHAGSHAHGLVPIERHEAQIGQHSGHVRSSSSLNR
ncbi:MAG: hypothetical protein R2856_10725 [Caldilineaceae bacterium]